MAPQGGGGYAIVLGNNCTPEILNCTTYTFPYDGGPVQLVILGRTTLTPLFAQTFSGSAGEAVLAATQIGALAANEPIVVILAALLTGNTTQIDPSWFNVIGMIVPEPGVSYFNNSLITNVGGWSAIGIPAGSGTPRPVGHINTGSGDWSGVQYAVGDLRGYFQKQPGGQSWFFTTGGFAAFNTSASRTATGNTMQINGTAYPTGPLIAANGASCAAGGAGGGPGGFQLVVLNASTLNPLPPAFNTPVNQTFATNCGATDSDVAGIDALAAALGTVLSGPSSGGPFTGGALVFLQSIGAPIVPKPFAPQQEQAARAISPLVEQLGGVADAFNKSWWFASTAPGNPGYALVGSTALLGDAPSGAQIGVYGSEASSAAPGSTPPVLLDGLLKRNYLGRYGPVSAAATQGSEPAFLPVTVYQPAQAWPHSGQASELSKTLLTWFSETLGIQYTSSSSCYIPSYPNVRAEYCDTNPIPGAGEGWGHVASTLLTLMFPGTSVCACSTAQCVQECPGAWAALQAQLAKEMNWVGYIQSGLTTGGNSLRDVLTDSENNSYIDLEQAAGQVLDAVDMAGSSAAVAGFWVTLASNALKFAKNFASSDGLGPVLGIFSTIGPLGENLASLDSSTTLGQIQTTAQELPSQLSSRFIAAANQLGLFQSIVASDYGKLAALGENPVFQSNPFTDATWQAQVLNGVSLFAYGRLLGAAYYAWGLLPDSYNPGYPGSPADYFCGNVGTDGAYPFGNNGPGSADLTWTGFTYPNFLPEPLPAYGGNPNLLALGSKTTNIFSIYSTVPTSVMRAVVAGSGQPSGGGLADWDVWFFRHNFTQTGFRCSDLNPPRQPSAVRGQASKVGGPGDAGLVFIDATVTDAGPIDLSAARLVVSQVLVEADRAGELVRTAVGSPFLPLELTAARGSKPNRATFKTPAGARPIVNVEVTNRDVKSGRLAVSLSVNRARLPQTARACETGGTALLRTRIELDDGIHPPVTFSVERPWTCNRSRLATP
jgi:hypothetical protein